MISYNLLTCSILKKLYDETHLPRLNVTAGDMELNPPKINDYSSLIAMILANEQSPYTKFNINNKNTVDTGKKRTKKLLIS